MRRIYRVKWLERSKILSDSGYFLNVKKLNNSELNVILVREGMIKNIISKIITNSK